MLWGATSCICHTALQLALLPRSLPSLYVCVVELLLPPELVCWNVDFSEISGMWIRARVARKPARFEYMRCFQLSCWVCNAVVSDILLSCIIFCIFLFFALRYCAYGVTGASFTIAQSTVPGDSELSISFQRGFEYVWESIIFMQLLFSVTNLC